MSDNRIRDRRQLSIPLFFKLWFAFAALLVIAIISSGVWLGVSVIQAGPEGIGTAVGSAVRAFDAARGVQ